MRLFLALQQGWPVLVVHVTKKSAVLRIVTEEAAKVDFAAQRLPGWALVPCDAVEEFILPSVLQASSNELALSEFKVAEYAIPDARVLAVVLTKEAYVAWARTDNEKSYLPAMEKQGATHVVINFILAL